MPLRPLPIPAGWVVTRATARVLVGLVLVAGSALGAFGHDARTSDQPREAWLCQLDQPRCVAEMEADR